MVSCPALAVLEASARFLVSFELDFQHAHFVGFRCSFSSFDLPTLNRPVANPSRTISFDTLPPCREL